MSKNELGEKTTAETAVHELVQVTSTLKELMQRIAQLHSSIVLLVQAQLCREGERDSRTVEEAAKAADDYIASTTAIFERRLSTYIREMRNVDNELNTKLAQLYEPFDNLTREVKSILGESGVSELKGTYGVERSFLLSSELENTMKKVLENKKKRFAETYEEFGKTLSDVENSLVDLKAVLSKYSIKGATKHPVVIGIPVLKIAIGKIEEHSVLAGDLSKYAERLKNYAMLNPRFGVNAELYTKALEAIKQRRGVLYRLFLKLVVRCLK